MGEDGSYESKGAYVKALKEIDNDLPIVNKALIDYFINDVPVEKTIHDCNDLIEFQKIVKITSLYKYALYGDESIKEKVLRVFASTDENAKGVFKLKTEDRIEKISNTPEHCFIYNDSVIGVKCPNYIDKQYYVDIANKRIHDFIDTTNEKTTSKFKSDIKFVSYDVKEYVENLDFSQYSYFTDLVVDLLKNKTLNKKQLSILLKLNFFAHFGNQRELLRIFDFLNY